ncbi:MAG: peptidylprolyl isomerase [Clostridia bacterium]|nr:peptidylprolyl isomerase [Clostridia bacterium]
MQIQATITMQDGATITVELDPSQAPNTVRNFVSLARKGFYDGLIFHRVIPGFMIQGGCPQGTGTGGPGYCIPGEFSRNGHANTIRHTRGVISMARAMQPDSAGSQFFIMHQDSPHLDGQYAAFGRVTAGIETVDAIASVRTGANDRPREEQKIRSITIEADAEADEILGEPVTV